MVASLEQWALMLLKPDIPMILKEENMDEDTCERFSRAKKPSEFSITEMDYKIQSLKRLMMNLHSTPHPINTKTKLTKNFSKTSALV